ncbi:MAG: UDP-4-amino-4,6-dideoxy-N-acetyl-beta-L-altrosamine N-acetyltransferase [Clostridiales bacterium]|nr:UDP-4-amino-4,6-dideoxy-N-acetyl-beta-L-altrosamine N-acetyltransferase [Clostridiales bacterium]
MKLEKEGIYLRPITADDTEMVLHWRNSDSVKRFYLYRKDITPEEHSRWLSEKVDKGLVYQFIIVVSESDRPIGSVYIQHIDQTSQRGEFGIFIGETSAVGRGFGTTAAELIVQFAFGELGLHELYLRVLSDNVRAIRSYEHVGFSVEGNTREVACIDGAYHDVIRMSIKRGE